MKKILILCLVFLTFLTTKSQTLDSLLSVKPIGYINDYQNLFTPEQRDTLEKMMSDYEKKTSIEFTLVTYYVDPHLFVTDEVRALGSKWGVGKSNLDNGLIIFFSSSDVLGESIFQENTGYGLEVFLPDGKLSQLERKIFPNTLYVGLVYEAYKQFILACQNEIGFEGYEMLVENKKLDDIKRAEAQEEFLMWFLRVAITLLILGIIIYLVLLKRRKRKEFLELKFEILKILNNIEDIKNQVGVLPTYYQEYYNNKIDTLTNELVSIETKSKTQLIYNQLLDYKSTINSIKHSIKTINISKNDITKYLNNNYPYCEIFLKDELNSMLQFSMPIETNFTKKRMNALLGIKSSIDRKLKSFLSKTVKINSIINDKNGVKNKIDELSKLNLEYIRKKNILSSVNIGNRVFSNVNFNDYISKIESNINKSYNFLLNDNLDSALNYYGQSITTITLLKSDFTKVDVLFKEYNSSYSYLNSKKLVIKNLVFDVESKINRSGVSYYRKTKLENIKSEINKNKKLILVDVILAAKGLKSIISETESLLNSIRSDISSYERKKEEERRRQEYNSSSSGGSDFDGFGGGDFGGGGSGGRF